MNILFVFHKPIIASDGGVERVTSVLTKELERRSHHVFYLSVDKNIVNNNEEFSVHQECIYGYNDSRQQFLESYLSIIRKNNIQIIISQFLNDIILYLIANSPKNIYKIINIHRCPYAYEGNVRKLKKLLHSKNLKVNIIKYIAIVFPHIYQYVQNVRETQQYIKACEVCDKIVFLSQKFSDSVIRHIGMSYKNKITSINNPNTFSITDAYSEKENLFLYVGRLDEVPKNIHGFIDIWKVLSLSNPNWRAVIIGDGISRDYLEKYVKKNNVHNLHFLGKKSDVSPYYAKAKFICLTSVCEGWGMVLTEGMNYGCVPCVYGNYGSVYDIIDDNINGIISKPFDNILMAKRIQSLIDDEIKYKAMSFAAQKKSQLFSVEDTVDKWEILFRNIDNA